MSEYSEQATSQLKPRPLYRSGDLIKVDGMYRTFVCDRSDYYSERGIIEQSTEYNTSYMYYNMINTVNEDGDTTLCIDGDLHHDYYKGSMMIIWEDITG